MPELKHCTDCAHYTKDEPLAAMCGHSKARFYNLEFMVDKSGPPNGFLYCLAMRDGICGADARLFEPKDRQRPAPAESCTDFT